MSSAFSANQYEGAFKSHRLQNWTLPKSCKERPSAAESNMKFIATDQGHLLPGVKRGVAWTTFQGTWDLPRRLPPRYINPTARSQEGQERLRAWGKLQNPVPSGITGKHHEADGKSRTGSRTSHDELDNKIAQSAKGPDDPQEEMQTSVCQARKDHSRPAIEQSQASPRPATKQSQAPSRPATQQSQAPSRPATQQSQAPSRPATQQSQALSRPATQQSQASCRPATQQSQAPSRPATQQSQAPSRPATQQSQASSRPASQQSQASSRPPTQQNQAYSRPSSKKTHAESHSATQQNHVRPQPVSHQSQESRPLTRVSKA